MKIRGQPARPNRESGRYSGYESVGVVHVFKMCRCEFESTDSSSGMQADSYTGHTPLARPLVQGPGARR